MSILITGGTGSLGACLAKEMVNEIREDIVLFDFRPDYDRVAGLTDKVKIVSGNIADWPDVVRTIKDYDITDIVHLAALLFTESMEKPYASFKINLEGDREPYDAPGPGTNPAVELQEIGPDNKSTRRFVFAQQRGHVSQSSPLVMEYSRAISDWFSEVKVIDGGEVAAEKASEVNHPLFYGGYHFYQSAYGRDPQSGQMYTVLSVVNNTGVSSVYIGYVLLCIGTLWQLWFVRPRRYQKQETL